MRFVAFVHKETDSRYGVSFPDLPGCISAGESLDEALRCCSSDPEQRLYRAYQCVNGQGVVRRNRFSGQAAQANQVGVSRLGRNARTGRVKQAIWLSCECPLLRQRLFHTAHTRAAHFIGFAAERLRHRHSCSGRRRNYDGSAGGWLDRRNRRRDRCSLADRC
jgi:HicB-like antitoxin of HicAB toxin-antitoxin system